MYANDGTAAGWNNLPLSHVTVVKAVLAKPVFQFLANNMIPRTKICDIAVAAIQLNIVEPTSVIITAKVQCCEKFLKLYHNSPIYSYIYGPCFVGSYSDVQVSMK